MTTAASAMVQVATGGDWQQRIEKLRALHAHSSGVYRCDLCRDTGWQSHDVDGVERARRCGCVGQAWAAGVPVEFRTATLSNYAARLGNEAACARASKFLESGRDLVLVGGVGAGKTRLACSLLNGDPARGLFVRVPMMLRQLEPSSDDEQRAQFERRLATVPLLVLDDLGAERDQATDFTRRTLYMVYEARHDAGLRTIWTSNKSLAELADMHGDDRLTSRLAGWADVVFLKCSDQRVPLRVVASK